MHGRRLILSGRAQPVWWVLLGLSVVAWVVLLAGSVWVILPRTGPSALPAVAATLALYALAILFVTVLVLLKLTRRPVLVADDKGLSVRPSWVRTRFLPWQTVAEIAAISVPTAADWRPFLLIRQHPATDIPKPGDQPTWIDQGPLRRARRRVGDELNAYDLAVDMKDFHEPPGDQLTALREHLPSHVAVIDRLSSRPTPPSS